MRKLLIFIVMTLLVVIPLSCAKAEKTYTPATKTYLATTTVPQAAMPPTTSVILTQAPATGGTSNSELDTTYGTVDTERMIVRTGNMAILVDDITTAVNRITQLASQYQGYVVSSQIWRDNNRIHGNISIRIQAESYDAALNSVSQIAVEVTSQSSTSQDVTEEYVDLNAQLTNLEATEQQLLSIMAKAEKIEDVLSVQNQLTNTRSQIEQIKGRMQYLEKTSSTSLLNISLEQALLAVKLTADKTQVHTGEIVSFNADINGGVTPYTYEWNFGDGNKSNELIVVHQYKSPGTYTVSLKVTDDRGNSNTDLRQNYITVTQPPGWNGGNVAGAAWKGLVAFGRILADILIWVGIFSPLWIICGGIVLFIRYRRKRMQKK